MTAFYFVALLNSLGRSYHCYSRDAAKRNVVFRTMTTIKLLLQMEILIYFFKSIWPICMMDIKITMRHLGLLKWGILTKETSTLRTQLSFQKQFYFHPLHLHKNEKHKNSSDRCICYWMGSLGHEYVNYLLLYWKQNEQKNQTEKNPGGSEQTSNQDKNAWKTQFWTQ